MTINATLSTTYYVQVDGFAGSSGFVKVQVLLPPPANDAFSSATAVTIDTPMSGSIVGATVEVFEPLSALLLVRTGSALAPRTKHTESWGHSPAGYSHLSTARTFVGHCWLSLP